MNFLTSLYFKYETMVKGPSSESRLHKPRPDPSADEFSAWHPIKANRARKHMAAPAARRSLSAPKLPQYREKEWGDSIHDPILEDKNILEEVVDMGAAFELSETAAREAVKVRPASLSLMPRSESSTQRLAVEATPQTPAVPLDTALRALPMDLLLILTYAPNNSFLTLTLKRLRNVPPHPSLFISVAMYTGSKLTSTKSRQVEISSPSGGGSRSRLREVELSTAFLFSVLSAPALAYTRFVIEIWEEFMEPVVRQAPGGVSRPAPPAPMVSSQRLAGRVIVGSGVAGAGFAHWRRMLQSPGYPACLWHKVTPPNL